MNDQNITIFLILQGFISIHFSIISSHLKNNRKKQVLKMFNSTFPDFPKCCWKCNSVWALVVYHLWWTLCGHWLSTCGGHGLGWGRIERWMECIAEKNFIGALFGKIQNKPCQISKVEDWTNYGMSLMHFRLKRISDCRNFPFLHLQCIGKEISHYLLPLAFIPQKWHSQWHFY